MRKDVYDAMIRFCVDSFKDIKWDWEGLTQSERVAIGSKDMFEQIKREASDFLIVKPSPKPPAKYEALLIRCNKDYADTYPDDLCLMTDVGDHWTTEWCIFLIEDGSEADEWQCKGLYFQDKVQAMRVASEWNRAQ